ncbi:MAG: hypothetical protein Q8R57_03880 [Bacteroidota bacterium]|nr:hypothetical protein [Bacteroidota bacterium]
MRGLFAPLSRPTPVLDYLYDMTGHVSDNKYWTNISNDTSSSENWYMLYWEHFYMAYDTSSLQTDENIYENVTQLRTDTIPFGVLDKSYYKFVDDALTTNAYFTFDTINDRIYDITSRSLEPYVRGNIFTAAPLYEKSKYGKITWLISPSFIFKDADNSPYYNPANYQFTVDFGDGNGPQLFDPTTIAHYVVDYHNLGIDGEVIINAVISLDGTPIKTSRIKFMLGKTNTQPRPVDEIVNYGDLL